MDEKLVRTVGRLMQQYQMDLPLYAASVLKLVDKQGNLVEFKLNPLQQKLHDAIETQKANTGKVRVIVLKSRKLGMSTYTAARLTHATAFNKHKRAVVTTHVSDSTNALFRIYKRFHENLPEFLQPTLKRNNARELEFNDLDSSIKVTTAGSKETGRGDTFTHFHASEIGFWPNDYEIAAGLLQSIADVDGTEIIIESTPNGLGNLFHSLWDGAVNGTNGYLPIFFGWSDDPTCTATVPANFQIEPDEKEYARLWKLTDEQVYWRRLKIKQVGIDKFTQEYPISAAEAFRASTDDSFITSEQVLRARKARFPVNIQSPLILGVDVARSGKDMSCVVWRKGRNIIKYKKYAQLTGDELAYKIVEIIKADNPAKICVDGTGGFGSSVIDCLRMLGYDAEEVHFSSKPNDAKYFNKRAEMYGELRDWLQTEVSIPDEDEIESDLTSFGYKFRGEKLLLESKEDVKQRIKRSPDVGDAIALTFAVPYNDIANGTISNVKWDAIKKQSPDYAW
jgi:hypothetical protein